MMEFIKGMIRIIAEITTEENKEKCAALHNSVCLLQIALEKQTLEILKLKIKE